MSCHKVRSFAVARMAGALFAASFTVPVAQAATVSFLPGTFHLQDTFPPPFLDPNYTVVVSVQAGIASFTITGAMNESFSVPDVVTPSGLNGFGGFYLTIPPVSNPSWDSSTYPTVNFYPESDYGGLSIGPIAEPGTTALLSLFTSNTGSGQLYATPLPASWTMMLAGLGLIGFMARYRRVRSANGTSIHAV